MDIPLPNNPHDRVHACEATKTHSSIHGDKDPNVQSMRQNVHTEWREFAGQYCSWCWRSDNPLHEYRSPVRDGLQVDAEASMRPVLGWRGHDQTVLLDRHRNHGKAGNKQRHGNESGKIAGECSHSQLLCIPSMYYLCSTFVPLSITTGRFLFAADSTALSAARTGVSHIPPRLSFTGLLALAPSAGQ
jgi:hypothetical protein